MSTDQEQYEIDLYGVVLAGTESELDLARLARIAYLKKKMRPRLAQLIGDYGDNITDVTRVIVLGEAIRIGLVEDSGVIAAHRQYVSAMLDGYGGAEAIIAILQQSMSALQAQLIQGYYQCKAAIYSAQTIEDIDLVDLPGEPVNDVSESP